MKQMDDILRGIIERYAQYNQVEKTYSNRQPIEDRERQQIEAQLISFFSQYITQDGTDTVNIEKNWKKLRFLFHPDKFSTSSPEIRWVEHALSGGEMNGACFKLIDACASDISNPCTGINTTYKDISEIEQLIRTIKERRASAKTFTQIALIDSILSLLKSLNDYDATTGKIGRGWLSGFMSSMPWLTSGFCVGLYLYELSLLYALTFTISKSGRVLESSNSRIWQVVGQEMQTFSLAISRASMALIAAFVNVNVLVCDKIFYIGIEACASIYNAITRQSIHYSQTTFTHDDSNNASCTTLSLSPQTLLGGKQFETLPLKLLAINFEGYLEKQKQQYFAYWRLGDFKKSVMEYALDQLLKIDRSSDSLANKLEEARKLINEITMNKRVNVPGSNAAKTIKDAALIQRSFIENKEEILAIEENTSHSLF